jgi:prepilin-type N-terminal cleavage/methylation domain-containing protein
MQPGTRRTGTRAFTLIEMLVVVAIIMTLVAIAMPNYMDAMARARVVRARADMRTISIALETYFLEFNQYPPDHDPFPGDIRPEQTGLFQLTTPLTYLVELPEDIFSLAGSGLESFPDTRWFKMASTGVAPPYQGLVHPIMDAYALYSRGPDGGVEFRSAAQWTYDRDDADPCAQFRIGYLNYAPTNGTKSWGDLVLPGGEYKSGLYCVDGWKVVSGQRPIHYPN